MSIEGNITVHQLNVQEMFISVRNPFIILQKLNHLGGMKGYGKAYLQFEMDLLTSTQCSQTVQSKRKGILRFAIRQVFLQT